MSKLSIQIGDRELFLKVNLFEGEESIDIDKLLKIDILNLVPEILTFPVILNKLGVLLADKDNEVKEKELTYKIWRSKQQESIRTKWNDDDDKKVVRGSKFTKDEVEDAIIGSPVYVIHKKKIFRAEKERDYMKSIYWAAKDKADKLEKLSLTLKSEEIDLNNVAKKFNGVVIRVAKPIMEG